MAEIIGVLLTIWVADMVHQRHVRRKVQYEGHER
jgi:hypothetical protein